MSDTKGKLVVISAPSGTGKSTVIGEILRLRPEFEFSISATTRERRGREVDGADYHFITVDKFKQMIEGDGFLEWAEYVGNFYGTPRAPIDEHLKNGKTVLLDIEVQGAAQVMEKAPYAITFFIVPPSMEELERRLRGRGTDGEEKLKARLARAEQELQEKHHYKHIVVNDVSKKAAQEIIEIIDGEVGI